MIKIRKICKARQHKCVLKFFNYLFSFKSYWLFKFSTLGKYFGETNRDINLQLKSYFQYVSRTLENLQNFSNLSTYKKFYFINFAFPGVAFFDRLSDKWPRRPTQQARALVFRKLVEEAYI